MSNQPQRRFTVEIKAGADTRRELVALLHSFAQNIEDGSEFNIFGSPNEGGGFRVVEDPTMTHDRYVAALELNQARISGSPT